MTVSSSQFRTARIARLELSNFRCFRKLEISFDSESGSSLPGDWHCLFGANGAGKTAVLQAIALCIVGGSNVLEFGGEYLLRSIRRETDDGSEAAPEAQAIVKLKPEKGASKVRGFRIIHRAGDPVESFREGDVPSPPLVLGYGANRTVSDYFDSRHNGISQTARRVVSLFDPLASLAQSEVLLRQSGDLPEVSPLLEKLLEAVLPETVKVTWDAGSSALRFCMQGAGLAATELPDGFRSSAAWMADLCAQWAVWRRSLGEPAKPDLAEIRAIVLMDEIDLHLHPSLQRTIVPSLRKALPNVQWIVTTHSPLILGSFDRREIIALDPAEPGGIRQLDRQILGFTADQIYEWLMNTDPRGRSLEQLLGRSLTPAQETQIAEALLTSPETNLEQAREKLASMRASLARLKNV